MEEDHEFVGFLDVRDLISYVIMLHDAEGVTSDTTFNDVINSIDITTVDFAKRNPFTPVSSNDSLLTVAQLLARREVHRVPVVDNGSLVNIISQLDVIRVWLYELRLIFS